jgi:hypothetical protein
MKCVLYREQLENFLSVKNKDFSEINSNPRTIQVFGTTEFEFIGKRPKFIQEQSFNDEKTFRENLKNPLYSISNFKVTIVVEEYNCKVALKLFWSHFNRDVGKPWFKVSRNVEYITVNKNTGDVYVGYIHNYQKKRKSTKSIRKNYFANEPLSVITSKIKNISNQFLSNSDIANNAADIFINSIMKTDKGYTREQNLMKFYLDKKNFRYPNNFFLYSNIYWDKQFKKTLKKNGGRFVDAFMILNNLSGKKIKKALHQCNNLNIDTLKFAQKLFGDDWLNQDDSSLVKILEYRGPISTYDNLNSSFSKEELKKVYKLFINYVCEYEIEGYTFIDHIRMYRDLKNYGETDIKWTSDGSDFQKFNQEHLDWSEKLEHYIKGTYSRTYPEYFFEKIQKPIDEYYPVILTDSNSYNQESLIQSNCVKGYIGKPSAMIISLRKGSIDSENRVTIEYWIIKTGDKIMTSRIQTLGRFNTKVDDSWNEILFKLDEIVLSCHQDQNFKSVTIMKECLNKNILTSESHFDKDGILRWSYKIEDTFSYTW